MSKVSSACALSVQACRQASSYLPAWGQTYIWPGLRYLHACLHARPDISGQAVNPSSKLQKATSQRLLCRMTCVMPCCLPCGNSTHLLFWEGGSAQGAVHSCAEGVDARELAG